MHDPVLKSWRWLGGEVHERRYVVSARRGESGVEGRRYGRIVGSRCSSLTMVAHTLQPAVACVTLIQRPTGSRDV
jgi:hypothetical protein